MAHGTGRALYSGVRRLERTARPARHNATGRHRSEITKLAVRERRPGSRRRSPTARCLPRAATLAAKGRAPGSTTSATGGCRATGKYVDGQLDGPWKWYRENGKLMQTGGFKAGEQTGSVEAISRERQAVRRRQVSQPARETGGSKTNDATGKMSRTKILRRSNKLPAC